MNSVQVANTRDFWLTTEILDFMQNAYGNIEKLCSVLGNNYVVSGCYVNGASVSAGVIVLNGSIMPFKAGVLGANVRIMSETLTYTNSENKTQVTTTYWAEFGAYTGSSTVNFNWDLISKPFVNTTKLGFDFGGSGELLGTIKERTTRVGMVVTASHVTMELTDWNNSGNPSEINVYPSALSFTPTPNPLAPVMIKRGVSILWGTFTNNGSSYVIKLIDNAALNIGDVVYLENIHK